MSHTSRIEWLPENTVHSGTCFLDYVPENITPDMLKNASGMNPTSSHAYYDPEKGYEGWELHGRLDGALFEIYMRFGMLKIGGYVETFSDGAKAVNLEDLFVALQDAVRMEHAN